MAASIPVLRVLFNEVKATSRRYYYASNGKEVPPSQSDRSGSNNSAPKSLTTRVGGRGAHNSTVITVDRSRFEDRPGGAYPAPGSDGGSDRIILQDIEGKIVRTNEVEVEYHDKGDSISMRRA